MKKKKEVLDKLQTYMFFAGPATFIFFTVMLLPFLFGIYLTFTNWDGISNQSIFVGWENYLVVFSDIEFWGTFLLTLRYVFFSVLLTNLLAFFLGYILSGGIKGQNFLRAGFFTPNLIGGILLGLMWRFLFSNGLVFIGNKLHIDFLSSSWLADPDGAFRALIVVTVWQYSGYMMIIYIAGFMTIPRNILEAASIDGANGFTRIKNIILPLMVPSFVICIFLSLQRGFMVYDVNLALTQGGPYRSTELISMHVYRRAFLSQDYGGGQAEAFFLFLIVTVVTLTQVYFSKKLEMET